MERGCGSRYGTNTANNGQSRLQEAFTNKSLKLFDDIYIDGYTAHYPASKLNGDTIGPLGKRHCNGASLACR